MAVYQLKLTNYLLSGESGIPVERLLYDSRIDDLSVYDSKATIEVNAAGSIQFTVPKNHPFYDDIQIGRSWIDFVVIEHNNPYFVIGGCVSYTDKDLFGNLIVNVYGAPIVLHDSYLPAVEFAGGYATDLISIINTALTDQTVNKFEMIAPVTVVQPINLIYGSAWDLLTKIRDTFSASGTTWNFYCKNYGGIYHGYLSNTIRDDQYNTYSIKAGTNLVEYHEEVNEADIYSGIQALGAETGGEFHGEPIRVSTSGTTATVGITWDSTLVTKYGKKVVTRIYENLTSAEALASRATSELTALHSMKKRIKVRAIDIDRMQNFFNGYQLLFLVYLYSSPTVSPEQFIIKKIEYDLNNPANDTVELTNYF